jgi:hypothetical protein
MLSHRWHNRFMLVITKHRVAPEEMRDWLDTAKAAIAPLATRPGCVSVGAYRKALSSFEVKAQSIPFLSTAIDESSAFELVFETRDGDAIEHAPARAWDADIVGLGDAAGSSIAHRIEH